MKTVPAKQKMVALFSFLLGSACGILEGRLYSFSYGGSAKRTPPGWILVLALLAIPALSASLWTELQSAPWRLPIIMWTVEALLFAGFTFREWLWKNLIEPYSAIKWFWNKILLLLVFISRPENGEGMYKVTWRVIAERIVLPLSIFGIFLMLMMSLAAGSEKLETKQFHLLFLIPGVFLTSSMIVAKRWQIERKQV